MPDICCCGCKTDNRTLFYIVVIVDILLKGASIFFPVLAIIALVLYLDKNTENHGFIKVYALIRLVFGWLDVITIIVMLLIYGAFAGIAVAHDPHIGIASFIMVGVIAILMIPVWWDLHLSREFYKTFGKEKENVNVELTANAPN